MKYFKWRWIRVILFGLIVNFLVNQIFGFNADSQGFLLEEVIEAIFFSFVILEGIRKINITLNKRFPWQSSFNKRIIFQFLSNLLYTSFILNFFGSIYTILVHGENFNLQEIVVINIVASILVTIIVTIETGHQFYKNWLLSNQKLNNAKTEIKDLKKLEDKQDKKPKVILSKKGTKEIFTELSAILYFNTENKLVFLRTEKGEKFLLDLSLDKVQQHLNSSDFYRANRQFIISYRAIDKIESGSYGKVLLYLKPYLDISDPIIVSRIQASNFRKWYKSKSKNSISA